MDDYVTIENDDGTETRILRNEVDAANLDFIANNNGKKSLKDIYQSGIDASRDALNIGTQAMRYGGGTMMPTSMATNLVGNVALDIASDPLGELIVQPAKSAINLPRNLLSAGKNTIKAYSGLMRGDLPYASERALDAVGDAGKTAMSALDAASFIPGFKAAGKGFNEAGDIIKKQLGTKPIDTNLDKLVYDPAIGDTAKVFAQYPESNQILKNKFKGERSRIRDEEVELLDKNLPTDSGSVRASANTNIELGNEGFAAFRDSGKRAKLIKEKNIKNPKNIEELIATTPTLRKLQNDMYKTRASGTNVENVVVEPDLTKYVKLGDKYYQTGTGNSLIEVPASKTQPTTIRVPKGTQNDIYQDMKLQLDEMLDSGKIDNATRVKFREYLEKQSGYGGANEKFAKGKSTIANLDTGKKIYKSDTKIEEFTQIIDNASPDELKNIKSGFAEEITKITNTNVDLPLKIKELNNPLTKQKMEILFGKDATKNILDGLNKTTKQSSVLSNILVNPKVDERLVTLAAQSLTNKLRGKLAFGAKRAVRVERGYEDAAAAIINPNVKLDENIIKNFALIADQSPEVAQKLLSRVPSNRAIKLLQYAGGLVGRQTILKTGQDAVPPNTAEAISKEAMNTGLAVENVRKKGVNALSNLFAGVRNK